MNDIILSALLNLFALFGSLTKSDKKKAESLVINYLSRFFGVRNIDTYLSLYSDLRDFYDDFPDLDKNTIVEGICSNIQHKVQAADQAFLYLRFMEFSSSTNNNGLDHGQDDLFKKVATLFNISDSLHQDFLDYVEGRPSPRIVIFRQEGIEGDIKVLDVAQYNKIVFTYSGEDEVLMNDIPILPNVFMEWEHSGVLKSRKSSPLYYSSVLAKFEDENSSEVIELVGKDINFRFPNSENGMHNFTFSLHSGQLVAIMGGSGVGKSTLLSILNGNIKPQEGSITLNGADISDLEVKKHIGFVPQDDLLIEELTVYQNLYYTARLCFDKMAEDELDKKVNSVLYDLGLEASKDLKVGSAMNKYISGGQRKRLNIALELIREPSVLFLDEPTSGLSSSDSEKVMNLLKEQTYKGKLIVVNIHQPSSDIYKLFDRLWLLDKGGYPIYDGNPIEAISYFKRAANYADAQTSTCSTCGNVNPEIVLDIIDAKSLNDSGHITDKRKVSPKEWHDKYLETRDNTITINKKEIPSTDQKKPSSLKQMMIFLSRNFKTKITNTQYILLTILEAPILAVIVSFLTKFSGEGGYSVMYNKNLVSYFFMAIIVSIFLGMIGSAVEIFKDRALLKRERFLNLSHNSYIWSKIIYMAGVSLIQTLLFVLVGNSIMRINDLFFVWWFILFLSSFLANLTGLVLSQSLSSVVAIYITIPLLLIPQILLCGLVVKFDDLTPNSKTGNVPIIGDLIPSRWAYEALAVTFFTSNDYEKLVFDYEKDKLSDQYYRNAFLYELESQLETIEDSKKRGEKVEPYRMEIIRHELPRLASVCQLPEYEGSYDYHSLNSYFKSAEKVLDKRSTKNTLMVDRILSNYIKEHGKDELLNLKRGSYNLNLEDMVMNLDSEVTHKVVGNSIVPKSGYIFLNPKTNDGRAPFYSSVKVLFGVPIHTLWFNMAILIFMSIITSLALFFDIPGKYARKNI